MSDAKKKKIVLKKKGESEGKKPVIRLNKPAPAEAPPKPVEEEAAPQAAPKEKPSAPDAKATVAAEVTEKEASSDKTDAKAKSDAIFKFYCVYCGQKLSAAVSAVGKSITCPACKRKISVPEPPAE